MATPKPKWGAMPSCFHEHQPDPTQLEKLYERLTAIIEVPLSPYHKESIRRLIILMENKKCLVNTQPKKEEMLAEIQQTARAVHNLHEVFTQKQFSYLLQNQINMTIIKNGLTDETDPVYNLYQAIEKFMPFWESLEAQLQHQKNTPQPIIKFRDEALIELARMLDNSGLKPTTTRGGIFEKYMEEFLAFVGMSVEDPHPLVRKAISEYPNTPKLSLLEEGIIYPGLTG